jgi:tryptophan 2,3-dioxygenase
MVAQIDVLETMTPVSFLSFRARLESASGFQSYQFREFEFLLGKKSAAALGRYEPGSSARSRLERRMKEPTVYDGFLLFLVANGQAVPGPLLSRDVTGTIAAHEDLQKTLIEVYHTDPALRQICEMLVDLDEGIQEWRYRHVKMVERTIGFKQGTGGSPGVAYLRSTLFEPLFADLWAIRTAL